MNEYNCFPSSDTLFACILLYNLNNIVVYKKNHLNFLKFKLIMSNSNAKKRPYERKELLLNQRLQIHVKLRILQLLALVMVMEPGKGFTPWVYA
jgi:hypothetical protein